jgi:hypothetical protein
MSLPQFVEIRKNINNLVLWSDCGPQMRCAVFVYFLFDELAEENILVNLNHFVEKHGLHSSFIHIKRLMFNFIFFQGKNSRDSYFSIVSKALENYILRKESALNSAEDVINPLNASTIYLNEDRLNKKTVDSLALHFNPPVNEIYTLSKRIVPHLQTYYNFQNIIVNGKYTLFSSLYSDRELLTLPIKTRYFFANPVEVTHEITLQIVRPIEESKRSEQISRNLSNKRERESD